MVTEQLAVALMRAVTTGMRDCEGVLKEAAKEVDGTSLEQGLAAIARLENVKLVVMKSMVESGVADQKAVKAITDDVTRALVLAHASGNVLSTDELKNFTGADFLDEVIHSRPENKQPLLDNALSAIHTADENRISKEN